MAILVALVNVAIGVSIAHNGFHRICSEWNNGEVGSLWSGAEGTVGVLDLPEACNKILSARDVEFSWPSAEPATAAVVTLFGEERGQEWRASFEVSRFADAVFADVPMKVNAQGAKGKRWWGRRRPQPGPGS